MAKKRLLLLSNSRNYKMGYLEHARGAIREFLGKGPQVLFVPYAGVTIGWDDYAALTTAAFREMGYRMVTIHQTVDPVDAVANAEAIAVGGGNTFYLLSKLYETSVLDAIRERVQAGVPYMGWSAGSNVACPTIKTTNDMPVVEPPSFAALGLVPFQINPHYTDAMLPHHQGETRADRIAEFTRANPEIFVVGLREGSMLRVEGDDVALLGEKEARATGADAGSARASGARVFREGDAPVEVAAGDSLAFLLAGSP